VQVIMRALETSSEKRYRDGAEIESALRDAWDRCLTQGLVHPSVLAMNELPHEKAPPLMHAARASAPVAAPVVAQSGIDDGKTLDFASHRPAPANAAHYDDEKTTVLVRDDLRASMKSIHAPAPKADRFDDSDPPVPLGGDERTLDISGGDSRKSAPALQASPPVPPPIKRAMDDTPPKRSSEPVVAVIGKPAAKNVKRSSSLAADRKRDPFAVPSETTGPVHKQRQGLPWGLILLVLLLLAVGATAALYYLKIIVLPFLPAR
jgi:hypothetical protein